jgi:HPt (histidine-containing phosphotransfer) domain-containing protein
LLVIFQDDSRACLSKARAALANGELSALSRAAHTMKGMMRNLAMNSGAEIAANLETEALEGRKDASEQLLSGLEAAIASILREVEVQMVEVKT